MLYSSILNAILSSHGLIYIVNFLFYYDKKLRNILSVCNQDINILQQLSISVCRFISQLPYLPSKLLDKADDFETTLLVSEKEKVPASIVSQNVINLDLQSGTSGMFIARIKKIFTTCSR